MKDSPNSRQCEICGLPFLARPDRIRNGQARFCSLKCWGASKSNGTRTAESRFWSMVEKSVDGCWNWTGPLGTGGYGQLVALPVRTSGPRFSYELHFGEIPKGMCVCHRCDNRLCVRPDHLFLGTKSDNNKDATQKGRNAHGSRHGRSKINESQAIEILSLLKSGHLQREVAASFGLTQASISRILHSISWKRVREESQCR